ncbi:Bug family tripartite tricarboxylate transporter substrate binding protein [Parapusillimonas sp. JC17]|uniref:Bug family tripartite tricarboxylate transporter substrate binding protein n=1 Tax=Parapusillimonas sp. JC17 TaxID=3445768 RepID=UPI003F9F14D6
MSYSLSPSFKQNRRTLIAAALASALGASFSLPAMAQGDSAAGYPNKPVKLVVPFAPGGPTDITARLIGEALSKKWDQPVVMENRAGAGGTIGAATVSKAAPDGYTLVLGVTGSHSIAGSLYKQLPYDPQADFEPISRAVIYPNAILANPALPANNLQELIALAKKDKELHSYGTDGNGTASHLTMELLKERGGFKLDAVQYKGASPMLNDLAAGFIQVGITGLPSAETLLQAGKVKLIAITTDKDYSEKGYATIAGQGFPGFAAAPWSGLFAPKGTPKEIVEKISKDVNEVMNTAEMKEKMKGLGLQPLPNTPEQFKTELAQEAANWAKAVEISGARVE